MNVSLQLKIKSFGDDFILSKQGVCSLHSSFTNAVNFVSKEGRLISIVTEDVGGGPNNLVLSLRNVSDISFLEILPENTVKINKITLKLDKSNLYNSLLDDIEPIDFNYFVDSFLLFKHLLLKNASTLSSAFLLDERRKNFFITPFEKSLHSSIRDNVNLFLSGEMEALRNLRGLGFGLTPQGDDLINGFIIAIYVYGKIFKEKTHKLRSKIYEFSKGSNIISDTFLRYSVSGKLYSRMKNLILSMFFDRNKIEKNTMLLLKIGETSGSDIGTGFILMFEKLLEGGLAWL